MVPCGGAGIPRTLLRLAMLAALAQMHFLAFQPILSLINDRMMAFFVVLFAIEQVRKGRDLPPSIYRRLKPYGWRKP